MNWFRALVFGALIVAPPFQLLAQEDTPSSTLPTNSDPGNLNTGLMTRLDATNMGATTAGTGNFARTPFRVSIGVREGYDDNVYTTTNNTVGSFFTNGSVTFDYKFGNARTQFDLQAIGGLTYYYHRPFGQDYDLNTGLTVSFSHQATPRLGFGANAYLSYQSEPDFNAGIGLNRRSGNYFYTSDRFSVSYNWTPRFSTLTSYTLGVLQYENDFIASFEDRFEHTFGNEFRFLVLPTTTLVGEYRYEIIDFDTAPNDSMTHFLLAGVNHSFSPRFNVSLRAGVEFREFDNFGSHTSPYGEATLNYSLGPRTTISWVNWYGLDQPDIPGASTRTTFRTGINTSYAFSPRITGTLGAFYQHDDNEELRTASFFVPGFDEDTLDIAVGVRYEINQTFAALAGYSHTEVFSDITLREYARNRYYLGLNATF